MKSMGSSGRADEDDTVLSLTRLCVLNLADNMKEVWAKDYADNYLDHYSFRHIMGPFNLLREFVIPHLHEITQKVSPVPTLALKFGTTALQHDDM